MSTVETLSASMAGLNVRGPGTSPPTEPSIWAPAERQSFPADRTPQEKWLQQPAAAPIMQAQLCPNWSRTGGCDVAGCPHIHPTLETLRQYQENGTFVAPAQPADPNNKGEQSGEWPSLNWRLDLSTSNGYQAAAQALASPPSDPAKVARRTGGLMGGAAGMGRGGGGMMDPAYEEALMMAGGDYGLNGLPINAKTQECAFYMRTGRCDYGDRCRFSHPPLERKVQDCPYFMRTGTCDYGVRCRFNHPRDRGRVGRQSEQLQDCPYYMRTGRCDYGDNCKFRHPERFPASRGMRGPPHKPMRPRMSPVMASVHPPPPQMGDPAGSSDLDCPHYVRTGWCIFGDRCKFNHPLDVAARMPRPKQDCAFYLRTGRCDYGANCRYNHPPRFPPSHYADRDPRERSPRSPRDARDRERYMSGDPRDPRDPRGPPRGAALAPHDWDPRIDARMPNGHDSHSPRDGMSPRDMSPRAPGGGGAYPMDRDPRVDPRVDPRAGGMGVLDAYSSAADDELLFAQLHAQPQKHMQQLLPNTYAMRMNSMGGMAPGGGAGVPMHDLVGPEGLEEFGAAGNYGDE